MVCLLGFFGLQEDLDRVFWASRGIKQGDPLSPFLFTIVAKAMGALLKKAKDIGLIGGFEDRKSGEVVTHLQFADDKILFNIARWEEVANLKQILRCF